MRIAPVTNQVHFRECPTFKELFEYAKEYYIIRTCRHGCYAIVLELSSNGKINNSVI